MRRSRAALVAVVAIVIAVLGVAVAPASGAPQGTAAAVVVGGPVPQTLTGFDPGNIIEDAVFFAKDTMSAADIQAFLKAKVPTCQSGYVCLKDFGMATTSRAADAMCRSSYSGASWESAAQIIYKVAQACGINPQVLLVTLQKEQALVTHTWPSDWRFTKAMGQGCPDTAACDTNYYGFFNQVYGAAHQFKRYANPPGTSAYFTWFAPGRTWNVRYNPNAACGTSPVLIGNQATANLYYYTPYQPNAAALRAGYGAGDSCSAYGNRNFYNYFTDWFGSTRAVNVTLVRTESDPTVYLVSGSRRYRILNGQDYAELQAAFGPTYVVGGAFVDGLSDAGNGSAILRNESSGEISLIQSRARHAFKTCDLVAKWGGSCSATVNVRSSIVNRVPAAASPVTPYARMRDSGLWVYLDSTSIGTPLWDAAAVREHGGLSSTPPSLAINTATLASRTLRPLRFVPAQLVRTDSSPQVYLTDDYSRLLRVSKWSDVGEYARTSASLATVSEAQLAAGYRVAGDVTPVVRCGDTSFLVAGGRFVRLNDPAATGLAVSTLGNATCSQFGRSAATVTGPLFVKTSSSASVFQITGGVRRIMPDWQTVVTLNGGATPSIVVLRDQTLANIPLEPPIADGALAKSSASATISLVSGMTAHAIPSFAMAGEIGLPMTFKSYAPNVIALLKVGAPLSNWNACGGITYFGAAGQLRPVTAGAASGFTVNELSKAACAPMPKSAEAPLQRVVVQERGAATIYVAEAGAFRKVASWAALLRLGGGSPPPLLTVSKTVIATFPEGPNLN